MPVNLALKNLARDGRFSLEDARTLQQLVQRGQVSQAEARETLKRYGDVMDPEAGRLLEGFTGGQRSGTMTSLPPEILSQTIRHGAQGANVETLQRGLQALGMREQNPAFTMPSGVDGMFGTETRNAVRAFQQAHGITATGTADPATLQALDRALKGERAQQTPTPPPAPAPSGQAPRPRRGLGGAETPTPPVRPDNVTGPTGANAPGTPGAVVAAAESLVNGPNASHYGVHERWINNDPRHAAPANREINGTADRWKCNLFAGNVMAAAGFEPPYYGNRRTGGEYPNANQLYKWSDAYAARNGNQARFHMRDEIRDLPNMTPEQREARVNQMLERLQPGDLLIADHVGNEVSDGGHCRVFLGRDEAGNYRFAQAGRERAEIRSESAANLVGEEHLWILQPNTVRR
jgi:hypothetical protein